jgi:hypothetical protein
MRADTIWTAYGGIEAENPKTDSPFSRTEAIHLIHSLIEEQSRKMLRVLLCFDFAYGFPRDFSAATGGDGQNRCRSSLACSVAIFE